MQNIIDEHAAQTEKATPQEPLIHKDESGVYDIDAFVKRSAEAVTRVRLMGKEYTLRKLTKDVMAEFNELGRELKRLEKLEQADPERDHGTDPHTLAARQLKCLLGTPDNIFDDIDIADVKEILTFIIGKVKGLGESVES